MKITKRELQKLNTWDLHRLTSSSSVPDLYRSIKYLDDKYKVKKDVRKLSVLEEAVYSFKRELIAGLMDQYDGNKSAVAESLGIRRTSLMRLLKKLRIS